MALEDIREDRIKKAEVLRTAGADPYPADTGAILATAEVKKKFAALAKIKVQRFAGFKRFERVKGRVVPTSAFDSLE